MMGDAGASPVVIPKEKPLYTLDELIRQRALDDDQSPLIAYPKTRLGIDDYELFSGKELNGLIDGAAKALMQAGIEPVYEDTVAGIYGISTLDYIITVFGLGRLGYTIFILSPRLPVNAVVNLLKNQNTTTFLYAPQFLDLATKISEETPLKLIQVLTRDQYDIPKNITPPFSRIGVDSEKEHLKIPIMMHSSGSTGLPRPITYANKRLMATMFTAQNLTAFQSVPLFHAHGFISFIQAIYKRKVIYLFNGNVPQTHDTVTKAIAAAKPEIVWTVPYVLKLLAEKSDGIEVLKQCKVVSCSGSRCPDELGDLLVSEGIHFGTAFGATEVALILTSLNRPRDDKAWNYLRPPPHVAPFIRMKPIDGEVCECVVLQGHRGKVMSNSDDPPNSYHTKDLFIAHPTIPNAWKFVGRLDDRVTLTNGEKVLPLPIEGRIQQDPLVKEAVVFGVDRPVPGLLLFRAANAAGLSDEEFLDRVWPVIEDANSRAEGFSQIGRDLVAVIHEDVDCPSTDKSSIKRAAVYREFIDVIDSVYQRLENGMKGTLKLSVPELEEWILKSFAELGINLGSPGVDFFSAGVDSLKAIQMRGHIVKNLDLGGNVSKCASMIVYDCGNAAKLARTLYAIRTGDSREGEDSDDIPAMSSLIKRFSTFEQRSNGSEKLPESHVVILTGATGSLGAHLLAQLVKVPTVSKIYCLLRTKSRDQTGRQRLEESLEARNLPGISCLKKVHPVISDLTSPYLGLESHTLKLIRCEVTHIIHCAWAVNFTLPVQSFTPQLAALQNLINISLTSPFSEPTRLLLCSSVGAAMATPSPNGTSIIPEGPILDLSYASPTGYARSKLIAERMIENAVTASGANATILRIGQIVPAKTSGSQLWNPNEMIPLMVRSALTSGTLPETPGSSDQCSWIDVDALSKSILEVGNLDELSGTNESTQLVYNLVHPRPFSWRNDFLPALKSAGVDFTITSWNDWLENLRKSDSDVVKNPSRKLLGFWEEMAKSDGKTAITFETKAAEERSEAVRMAERLLAEDYVPNLVKAWKAVW